MKKIEYVTPEEFGVTFVGSTESVKRKGCVFAEVTWNDDSKESAYACIGRLVAYIEDGFLTADDKKWYFYNISGDIEKEIPKEELGECTEIGCMSSKDSEEDPEINLYFFDKAIDNESKKTRVYVNANGEIVRPEAEKVIILGMPIDQLINYDNDDWDEDNDWEDDDDNEEEDDDWDDDDETPTCMELSRLKEAFKNGRSHLRGGNGGSAEK